MLQERINRVINNHQMSCQRDGSFLYILKGFNIVLDTFKVPVANLDSMNIHFGNNYYIKYEEAMSLGDGIISALKEQGFQFCIVNFNLFSTGYLSKRVLTDHQDAVPLEPYYLVSYPKLKWLDTYEAINIFNSDNPIKDISSSELSDAQRLDWLLNQDQ